jgi:arylsulfatase A-like enzyme
MRLIMLSALAALVALSCGGEPEPLNLVLVGLDTVRSDHMGCYGYERSTTPAIDRLADEAALFEYALSHSPWTLPSFATVFTSLYPTQHGAGFLTSSMGRSFPTLASILADNGYSTGAIVNTAALSPAFGIDRGFQDYDLASMAAGRVADGTTRDALSWIDRNAGRPFFIFVHYYDPHLSYSPPAPYDTLFDPEYAGPLSNSFNPDFLMSDRPEGFKRMNAYPAADKMHIEALYDGEIAYADAAIGDLLAGLDERDLRDKTLVVFLSDHGEEFFDHGGFAHGHTLYEELLHVPLMFSLPGRIPPARIPDIVRLVDVMPTILSLLGIETDAHMEGNTLTGMMLDQAPAPSDEVTLLPEGVLSEGLLYGPEQKSIMVFPWKLTRNIGTNREMLFNLDRDPGETENLIGAGTSDVRAGLESLLYKTLFEASDTWYVEAAAGGEEHVFDISITGGQTPASAGIFLYKAFDSDGNMIPDDEIGLVHGPGSSLSVPRLKCTGKITLGFKLESPAAPVIFDLSIDGRPAQSRTYIGEGMSLPDQMPFTRRGGRHGRKTLGKPVAPPGMPYYFVWHSGQDYDSRPALKMSRDVQKELRSLGYIQ